MISYESRARLASRSTKCAGRKQAGPSQKRTAGFILLDAIMTLAILSLGVAAALMGYQKLMQHHTRTHLMALAYLYVDSGLAIASTDPDKLTIDAWQREVQKHLPQGRGVLTPRVSISFVDEITQKQITLP